MKMDKNKIILISSITIFLGILSFIVLIVTKKETPSTPSLPDPEVTKPSENNSIDYIIINNTDVLEYINNNFYRTEKTDFNNKFNVYINNHRMGTYNLKYGNDWNLFEGSNYINYEGDLFAYTSNNLNIVIRNITKNSISNEDLVDINNILNKSIRIEDLSLMEKVEYDLDTNGIIDKIVSVSNLDSLNQDKYFNLLYVVLNNIKYILINEEVKEENVLIEPNYYINYVVNINNKLKDSIFIKRGYFSNNGETENILYEFENDKYVLKLS